MNENICSTTIVHMCYSHDSKLIVINVLSSSTFNDQITDTLCGKCGMEPGSDFLPLFSGGIRI